MTVQIGTLFSSIAFICLSILDIIKIQNYSKKSYKELESIRRWQKKKAALEAVVGLTSLTYCLLNGQGIPSLILSVIAFIGIILMIVNNHIFKKKSSNK